jgi:hypothetical protein
MLRLRDPILQDVPEPDGIELEPLREPDSLEMSSPYRPSTTAVVMTSKEFAEESRMVLRAVKRDKSFDWVGSRSALPGIVRQMEKFGWTVTAREE